MSKTTMSRQSATRTVAAGRALELLREALTDELVESRGLEHAGRVAADAIRWAALERGADAREVFRLLDEAPGALDDKYHGSSWHRNLRCIRNGCACFFEALDGHAPAEPEPAPEPEALRLFEPAPVVIPGQQTLTVEDARAVACPSCGAEVGRRCKRPSGHRAMQAHAERVRAAGVLLTPTTTIVEVDGTKVAETTKVTLIA